MLRCFSLVLLILILCSCAEGPGRYTCGDTVLVASDARVVDGVATSEDCREQLPDGSWDLSACCPDGYDPVAEYAGQVTCLVVCS